MPSLPDSIVLFVLALLLFGPKKLPVLARELGKWVGEFRRASNEFKMQMEEELRSSEREDREKKIAAMEAAAPVAPSLEAGNDVIPEPEHPHMPAPYTVDTTGTSYDGVDDAPSASVEALEASTPATPLPIATSGDLSIMPPATGLPTPRAKSSSPLGGLLERIPAVDAPAASVAAAAPPEPAQPTGTAETASHG
jgi:sec-independent protein translocase protein TatB